MDGRFHYWLPSRLFRAWSFPGWTILVPFMWPMLALTLVLWVVSVALWLVISVPVNVIRFGVYALRSTTPA